MPKQAKPPKLESLLDMRLIDFLPLLHKALQQSTYCGLPILKNPLDLFIYQEIIYKTKPNIIIEIGTYKGGSAKYLMHMLTHICSEDSLVITIDPCNNKEIEYDNIMYLKGKADSKKVVENVNWIIEKYEKGILTPNTIPALRNKNFKADIMVIDDGSHTYDDTLANLNIYSQFVSLNQYYIVEDCICHHGLNTGPKPGPTEAVDEFLKYCRRFLVDRTCERFGLTYNSGGFLKCIKAA